jgi:hypothetical protein
MKHLSDGQLLELLEGGASDATHLESCGGCRDKLEALRQVMAHLRDDHVPEPSPLFWQHFSERVRQALDDESVGNELPSIRWWTRRSWRWALAGGAAVVMATLVLVTNTRPPRTDRVADRASSSMTPLASGVPADLGWTPPGDDSWTMVVGLAEGLDLESAADAGLTVRPGFVDQAVLGMSDEEQRELAGIIQAELDRLSL